MAKDRYQVSLKVLLRDPQKRLLALKGKAGGTFDGYYDLPGGRIEVDEFSADLMEILRRELREELGDISCTVHPAPVAVGRHAIDQGTPGEIHVLYVFFEAEYHGGEIVSSAEHEGWQWLTLEERTLEKYFRSGILDGVRMYLRR